MLFPYFSYNQPTNMSKTKVTLATSIIAALSGGEYSFVII